MKRITCTLADEDAIKVIGAIVRCGGDFAVETLPADNNDAKKSRVVRAGKSGLTVPQLIMSHFTAFATFSLNEAEKWVGADGKNPKSASPAISQLCKKGYLEGVGKRNFKFIRKLEGEK